VFQIVTKETTKTLLKEVKQMEKELVIRYFMGGYYLCDGKPPKGYENDGELYVGNIVKWFKTWEEADNLRKVIAAIYTA